MVNENFYHKRCFRSCRNYIRDNDINDPNHLILLTKINFLIYKLDIEQISNILEKRYRVKDVINSTTYQTNINLKREHESILSKSVVDTNACNLYTCPRCKKREHTYREVMTRALDEPRSVKCICLICGYRFGVG